MKYKTLVVGGTFDKFHEGHKELLRFAFSLADTVYITITSDAYTALHKPHVASFAQRSQQVRDFLKKENFFPRAKIFSIDDSYGITSDMQIPLQAILVTSDTLAGAKKVNEQRKENGRSTLAIEIMPLVVSETGLPISSTFIRKGIFDKDGVLQIKKEPMKILHMPQALRTTLQQPFGKIIKNENLSRSLFSTQSIAVGDITTRVLHQQGISPALSLIDFMVERKKQKKSLKELGIRNNEKIYHVINPPATITPELWTALSAAQEDIKSGKKVVVIIEGEEDLTVLPCLLLAPFGYTIYYGQPHIGMVAVPVNKETKAQVITLLNTFIQGTTRGY